MPKLTLTAGAMPVAPVFSLVAGLAAGGGGVIRPGRVAGRGSDGYIVTPKNFSAMVADAFDSRFDGVLGRIFSTALNRFSITLSASASRLSAVVRSRCRRVVTRTDSAPVRPPVGRGWAHWQPRA
ncbi:hypothetical protein A6A25_35660 [Saccharothrix sp. CB00851]|nr:hypothetical protein A6A25_35660 [Saccharothrix sp. CB00851]